MNQNDQNPDIRILILSRNQPLVAELLETFDEFVDPVAPIFLATNLTGYCRFIDARDESDTTEDIIVFNPHEWPVAADGCRLHGHSPIELTDDTVGVVMQVKAMLAATGAFEALLVG